MNKNIFYYGIIFVVWLGYVYLNLQIPQTKTSQQFGLSSDMISILRITIFVPYLLIWEIALYGVLHLRGYASLIKESLDGKGILKISNGIGFLMVTMILTALVGTIRSMNVYNNDVLVPVTIISNYINVLIPLLAFYLIYLGSVSLLKSLPNTGHISQNYKIIGIVFLSLFSLIYIYLVFTNPNRQVAFAADTPASFYLPDILIILTVILPAVLSWLFGTLGCINIRHFMDNIQAPIYKKGLKNLVIGIIFVISGSIIIQALISLGTSRLIGIGLGPLLGIIYFFLIVEGLGYMMVALGSKSLSKIEQV